MGVFESAWWFYKNNIDLIPEHMTHGAGLYINRDNGVIMGFYNTSHEIDLSNWTTFYDPDKKIDEEEETSESSANPKLLFTIDNEDMQSQWPPENELVIQKKRSNFTELIVRNV